MGFTKLSSNCCGEIHVPLELTRCLGLSLKLPKGSQAVVVYDVECRVALDCMQGIQPSSQVDMGTRDILHSCGDISVLLDLLQCSWLLFGVPSSKSRLLMCLIGNTELI